MKQPVLFIGHGSPMNILEDNSWTRKWSELGRRLPRPQAILMISAHWYTSGTRIQTNPTPPMVYDMYGFPDELYEYVYPAPTSSALIKRVHELLGSQVRLTDDPERGYDHGAYSVLSKTHPEAQIPVVQLSSDRQQDARYWFKIGQLLSPLRDEGCLIFGSGNIVHNLRTVNPGLGEKAYDVCQVFDETIVKNTLALANEEDPAKRAEALDTLLNWEEITGAEIAAAWPDHLSPFYYALGAALGADGELTDRSALSALSALPEIFCQDYLWGSLSMTSVLWP